MTTTQSSLQPAGDAPGSGGSLLCPSTWYWWERGRRKRAEVLGTWKGTEHQIQASSDQTLGFQYLACFCWFYFLFFLILFLLFCCSVLKFLSPSGFCLTRKSESELEREIIDMPSPLRRPTNRTDLAYSKQRPHIMSVIKVGGGQPRVAVSPRGRGHDKEPAEERVPRTTTCHTRFIEKKETYIKISWQTVKVYISANIPSFYNTSEVWVYEDHKNTLKIRW